MRRNPVGDRLLAHFGSLKKLRHASVEELCAVKGISAAKAAAIRQVADTGKPHSE